MREMVRGREGGGGAVIKLFLRYFYWEKMREMGMIFSVSSQVSLVAALQYRAEDYHLSSLFGLDV